jgi:hypothetical protein
LLKPAKLGEILKIENVTAARGIPGAQRRNGNAHIPLLAVRGAEVDLSSDYGPFIGTLQTWKPKIFIDFGQLSPPEINEAAAENFFSGAIEEHNPALRSVVTNPPRMEWMMSSVKSGVRATLRFSSSSIPLRRRDCAKSAK